MTASPSTTHNESVNESEAQTASTVGLTAHQRMMVAMRVIDSMPFAKNLDNKQYQSVPIDQMRNAVRKACIEAGLVHRLIDIQYTSESRGATTHILGSAILRFESVDDPSDFVDQPTLGQSQDNGDKNLSKFMTNLLKNAYKAMLDIGEQDDIDSYSNLQIEEEAEKIEAIRQRREANRQKASADPFFGKAKPVETPEMSALRKAVGDLFTQGGATAKVVNRYKAEHGSFTAWDEATLRACIDECAFAFGSSGKEKPIIFGKILHSLD